MTYYDILPTSQYVIQYFFNGVVVGLTGNIINARRYQ